jgi:plastocyanin
VSAPWVQRIGSWARNAPRVEGARRDFTSENNGRNKTMKASTTLKTVLAFAMALTVLPATALAGGTVKAHVTKKGERPKRKVINMAADPNCVKANTKKDGSPKKVGTENAIVSKKGNVKNAIVYVKDGLGDAKFEPPAEKALIDQRGCMYKPHVLTVMTGQTVTVQNSDDTLHNIHSFAKKQRAFNFAQPQKGMTKDVEFKREEIVLVKCDVHPWMSAYVGVFAHPFHGVTSKKGTATLSDLPAGEYTLVAWHEEMGEVEQKVTVKDGEELEVKFEYE